MNISNPQFRATIFIILISVSGCITVKNNTLYNKQQWQESIKVGSIIKIKTDSKTDFSLKVTKIDSQYIYGKGKVNQRIKYFIPFQEDAEAKSVTISNVKVETLGKISEVELIPNKSFELGLKAGYLYSNWWYNKNDPTTGGYFKPGTLKAPDIPIYGWPYFYRYIDTNPKSGYFLGITAGYSLNNISFEAGLTFSQKGARFENNEEAAAIFTYIPVKYKVNTTFFDFPVIVKYTFFDPISFGLGFVYSKHLKTSVKGFDSLLRTSYIDNDFALIFAFSIKTFQRWNVSLDYELGLRSLNKKNTLPIQQLTDIYNRTLKISLAYSFYSINGF